MLQYIFIIFLQFKEDIWYKEFNFKPHIYDDGEKLYCILNQGGKEIQTSLDLKLFMFKVEEDLSGIKIFEKYIINY